MLLINLFGQPGAGKSTTRADVFQRLKRAGVNCEEVVEHAKKLTWSGRKSELSTQPYIFGKQLRDIQVLDGQVDVVLTDSPLLLSVFYGRKYCNYPESFYDSVNDIADRFNQLNYFIRRVKPYNPKGRNQSESESDSIVDEMMGMLDEYAVNFTIVNGDDVGAEIITHDIIEVLTQEALA